MWQDIQVIEGENPLVKKYVFSKENAVAESVLYQYPTYSERTVICCSTQSGCPIGCRFCGAGDNFVRSLTAEEIQSQPDKLLEDTNTNPAEMGRLQIMFMSMGEPMLNYKELDKSLFYLYEKYPNAALLISTMGPRVDYQPLFSTAEKIPTIGLQFSVHETTDEKRAKLIPFPAKLSLKEIAERGEEFFRRTGRTPFFNYCVHEGNNYQEDADRLHSLFNPDFWQATISVICERDEHVAAANLRQKSLADGFRERLDNYGFRTRVFDPAGQDDIGGGCGMLWFVQEWMRNNPDKARPSIGFGKPKVHTPGGPLSLPTIGALND